MIDDTDTVKYFLKLFKYYDKERDLINKELNKLQKHLKKQKQYQKPVSPLVIDDINYIPDGGWSTSIFAKPPPTPIVLMIKQ